MADDTSALRAEIEKLRAQIARTDARTYQFMTRFAHELRTPLGAILMWTHVLRSGQKEDQDAATEAIEASARSQSKMIGRLLEVCRALAGRLEVERKPLDFVEIVRAAVDALLPVAASREVSLIFSPPAAAMPVLGDRLRLTEVVSGLVENAIKFNKNGGSATVTLAKSPASVQLVVSDTGRGLGLDDLAGIFEAFRPAGDIDRRSGAGLGLGLTFAKLVIGLHGGSIRADSEGPERGSQVTVELPSAATT